MKIKVTYKIPVYNHAKQLVKNLVELGCQAVLTDCIDQEDETLYILLGGVGFMPPKNYIVWQIEQATSHWWNGEYKTLVEGALAIWDFRSGFNNSVPPGLIETQPKCNKDIDVLFYGSVNDHRREILNSIHGVTIVENIYGDEILSVLNRAKVVLNIHYYALPDLETFRINEALCCGCQVVSERIPEGRYPLHYLDLIYYAGDGFGSFEQCIQSALGRPVNIDLSKIDNKEAVRQAMNRLDI